MKIIIFIAKLTKHQYDTYIPVMSTLKKNFNFSVGVEY